MLIPENVDLERLENPKSMDGMSPDMSVAALTDKWSELPEWDLETIAAACEDKSLDWPETPVTYRMDVPLTVSVRAEEAEADTVVNDPALLLSTVLRAKDLAVDGEVRNLFWDFPAGDDGRADKCHIYLETSRPFTDEQLAACQEFVETMHRHPLTMYLEDDFDLAEFAEHGYLFKPPESGFALADNPYLLSENDLADLEADEALETGK